MNKQPRISAVICTHNREAFLEACIQSVWQQSLAREQFELIVVDNASSDRTAAICRRHQHEPGFRYVHEPTLGLSHARNRGWREAEAPYVGYLDDDAVAGPDWLDGALAGFGAAGAPEWVGGPIDLDWSVPEPDWITDDFRVALGFVNWGDSARYLDGVRERLGGGNSFYSRDMLARFGGFDTELGRKRGCLLSGEETILQHQYQAAGGRLFYHPDVLIHHHVAAARVRPGWFYRRYFWGGWSDSVMERKLKGVDHTPLDDGVPAQRLPVRLFRNASCAIGIGVSRHKRVQGRVYIAYVVGRLTGAALG